MVYVSKPKLWLVSSYRRFVTRWHLSHPSGSVKAGRTVGSSGSPTLITAVRRQSDSAIPPRFTHELP